MKKYALVLVLFISVLTSCSIENDDSTTFSLEVLPIESVEVPEQFIYGETYEIGVTYNKPNSCYQFNDFIYEIDGHERTIAVVNTVYSSQNGPCEPGPEEVTVHFDFMVTGTETYVFKFYQGEDAGGTDQYYLVEVPVINEGDKTDESGGSVRQ